MRKTRLSAFLPLWYLIILLPQLANAAPEKHWVFPNQDPTRIAQTTFLSAPLSFEINHGQEV